MSWLGYLAIWMNLYLLFLLFCLLFLFNVLFLKAFNDNHHYLDLALSISSSKILPDNSGESKNFQRFIPAADIGKSFHYPVSVRAVTTESWELLAWKLSPLWIQISRTVVLWNSCVVLGWRNKCYHHSQFVTEQLSIILLGIHRDGEWGLLFNSYWWPSLFTSLELMIY